MTKLNGDLDKLCAELQRMVMDHLALPDLIELGKTRNENNEGVKEYVEERRMILLGAFVEDTSAFVNIMERTGSIIAGSSALHLFQAKSEALELQDLDVYAMQEFEGTLLEHFKDKEGYKGPKSIARKKEYDSSAITKVHKLQNGEKRVDIMITDWASAIVPIVQYHSTAWTKDKKNLVNPITYMDDRNNISTILALMKYMQRGFRTSAEPFDMGIHNCHSSAYCPLTTRNTVDKGTLRWEFTPKKTVGKTNVTCDNLAIIIWRLGGQGCIEEEDQSVETYIGVVA
ncbi:uncharacterized protein F5147DRAFT_659799 [Suillus discolor]|uniref:Uncharacterized protein n=1 Tax=Suillus discolor TaxID=1912936 RepID=A0A9P7JL62_9AGAM|nr:uncharacterized protein F5147DRAFT_659799 [Suillus discolor]KAG2084535.1 hypothetical protein F5147DRAFT_659799 [Suillus discolor]